MDAEELFIPVEECLAIKELGFIRACFRGWKENWNKTFWELEAPLSKYRNGVMYKTQNYTLLAPTYEQVFDWFDEVFGYNSVILKDTDGCYHYNISSELAFLYEEPNTFNGPYKDKLEAKLECVKQLIILVHKTNI